MDSSFISDFSSIRAREIVDNLNQLSNGALVAVEESVPGIWEKIQVEQSQWAEQLQARVPGEVPDKINKKKFCRTVKHYLNQALFTHINKVRGDNVLGTEPKAVDREHPGATHRSLIATLAHVYATFSISELAAMDIPEGLEYEHREAMGRAVSDRLLNQENEIDVSGVSFQTRPAAFYGLVDGLKLFSQEAKASSALNLDLSECSLDSNMLYSLAEALNGQTVTSLNLANNRLDLMAIGSLESLVQENPMMTVTLSGNVELPGDEAQALGSAVIV